MTLLQSLILAVVEGLTEYLPISSTGHLILTSALMGIQNDDFVKGYTVIVQFGAILSVVVLYWRKFLVSIELYKKLIIAFLPAAVIGLLVKNKIDLLLDDVRVVAWSLILGGVILVVTDSYFKRTEKSQTVETLSSKQSLFIGFCQCVAFIPGVSRSAATLLAGLKAGLNRRSAAEFSFLLAVPTLTGATLIKTLKLASHLPSDGLKILVLGNLLSFVVGLFAIRFFIDYVSKHGLKVFGIYRILLGGTILVLIAAGYSIQIL